MQPRNTILYTSLCLFAVACARTQPDTSNPSPVAEDTRTEAAAPAERNTGDDEIFGVLDVIHDEAIAHGEYMKKWAKGQRVKEFAAMLITDHESVQEREKKIRGALDLRTSGSRLADDLQRDSRQKLGTLEEIEKGDPLDKAYIDTQVEIHAAWIGALDNQLIPYAQTPELRDELEDLRKLVERHYNFAVDLRSRLAAGQN